jgi:hypothetical protein
MTIGHTEKEQRTKEQSVKLFFCFGYFLGFWCLWGSWGFYLFFGERGDLRHLATIIRPTETANSVGQNRFFALAAGAQVDLF